MKKLLIYAWISKSYDFIEINIVEIFSSKYVPNIDNVVDGLKLMISEIAIISF